MISQFQQDHTDLLMMSQKEIIKLLGNSNYYYCWVWRCPSHNNTRIRFNDYYHVRRGLHVGLYYWGGLRRDRYVRYKKDRTPAVVRPDQ